MSNKKIYNIIEKTAKRPRDQETKNIYNKAA